MLRHGSSPSSSVSVDDGRGRLGERFVASWNERVELVEDDDACQNTTPTHDYMTTNTNTKSNISYFDFRDGTRKFVYLVE
jgi:hypothetical protein